ncbi:venom serine protease inhibitor-like [Halictus rubicundus]|uniref:venom serine protease inhibitor-like n=1 Tax=Halictus rubicundus TaxID=77578 RepID=UPI004035609E
MARCAVGLALLALVLAVLAAGATSSTKEKCPKNEIWSWCGRRCEPTCEIPEPTEKTCPKLECNPLKAACRCKESYVRNKQKICVHLKMCKK